MPAPRWWQRAVVYQIYPRSFADGNGDGIGDLAGATAGLDHLRDLGVDAVWLSPHYPSPFLDCGYDISDYTSVAPEYGRLDDFRRFLDAAHDRGIRVLTDLVLNHTSDQHPWFLASRSARDHPMRDWYVWRDGVDGGPPNDWVSVMGGSAWEPDSTTGQHWYHLFLPEQPDLNWRNPEVRAAMFDVVRFWLDLGVDGFRLDAVGSVLEDPSFPPHGEPVRADTLLDAYDLPPSVFRRVFRYQGSQPGVHELLRELRALVATYPGDRVLVGEEDDVAYHGTGDDELHLLFNFPLMWVARLTPDHVRANQALRLAALPPGAWPCNTLGNHDNGRVRTRYGDRVNDDALARVHAALVLTLRGTPFLYQGEEIGMSDLVLERPDQLRDTAAIRRLERLTGAMGVQPGEAMALVAASTRDRCRSPFQWSGRVNAGFSPAGVDPWLPVNGDYAHGVNAAEQAGRPGSFLEFYRSLLRVRRATPALLDGDQMMLPAAGNADLAFTRTDAGGQSVLVALNLGADPMPVRVDAATPPAARVLFSTANRGATLAIGDGDLRLAPFEVLVAEVRPAGPLPSGA